ncbi:hypothetical protein QMK19_16580 [Streptomyces sp. H10-C2]|uniref:hypothetical protein n=1 Tax=unclassified Streptomyces TaxID=2593676 RepID=UPI0024BA4269|nr:MULTISPECIES: hypothetical protein [unclassified Streptomyces]MDJ0344765.1 hypothetical protein [Streptomyces sp. PH10-H1]MDJ0371256.1 hypothetical protein [Streptomyces sp. H10-C2]
MNSSYPDPYGDCLYDSVFERLAVHDPAFLSALHEQNRVFLDSLHDPASPFVQWWQTQHQRFGDHGLPGDGTHAGLRDAPWDSERSGAEPGHVERMVFFFDAHGTRSGVQLHSDHGSAPVASDGNRVGDLIRRVDPGGTGSIVLMSCFTGEGTSGGVAADVARVTGRTVYAPTTAVGHATGEDGHRGAFALRHDPATGERGSWIVVRPTGESGPVTPPAHPAPRRPQDGMGGSVREHGSVTWNADGGDLPDERLEHSLQRIRFQQAAEVYERRLGDYLAQHPQGSSCSRPSPPAPRGRTPPVRPGRAIPIPDGSSAPTSNPSRGRWAETSRHSGRWPTKATSASRRRSCGTPSAPSISRRCSAPPSTTHQRSRPSGPGGRLPPPRPGTFRASSSPR